MSDRKPGVQVIRGGTADVEQWKPPHVAHSGGSGESRREESHTVLTASQLDAVHQAAHKEGFEQGRKEGQEYGHREGLEQGRADAASRVARLDELLAALDRPFDQLDQQLENEVVTLVISMVRQLIRREVKLDPGQIVGVVREALGILPIASRNIRVVLHPDDAALVREAYTIGDHDQQWQIVEDPVIQHGGCRIHTDTSQIDATLESRLNSLIAPLLAAERVRDQADTDTDTDSDAADA